MVPAGAGLGLGLMLSGLAPLLPEMLQFPYLFVMLTFSGVCGGLYLIPPGEFIQVRPAATEKGKTLGDFRILLASAAYCFLACCLRGWPRFRLPGCWWAAAVFGLVFMAWAAVPHCAACFLAAGGSASLVFACVCCWACATA